MSRALDVDVAIIGAGPAGSTLASLLAMRGRSVACIDRDRLPRDKVCGEFLSWDAIPALDVLGVRGELDRMGAPPIHRCVVTGRRASLEFEFPSPARGISRMALDELLLSRAAELGAMRLDGWTATAATRSDEGWELPLAREGDSTVLRAKTVVGAWGRWGRMDLLLSRGFIRDRAHRHFGFKRHYLPISSAPTEAIRLFTFRSGYLGVSSVEGGIVNICGLAHESRLAGLKGGWEAFAGEIMSEEPALAEMFSAHHPAQSSFLSSEPVIFRPRKPAEGGLMMVGDAAGLVDPLTGNGMAMAIQSAFLAAPFVLERLDQRRRDRAIDSAYIRAFRGFFASRIRWSRQIALLLSRPALLDASLRSLAQPAIGRFLADRTRADATDLGRLLEPWSSPVRNL